MQETFDPEELKVIQRAIFAVLNAAPFTGNPQLARHREVRALAARCVLNEARTGEFDPAALVYKSSLMFCATHAIVHR